MVTRRSVRQAIPSGAGHRGTTLARRRSEESVSGRCRFRRCGIPDSPCDRTPDGSRRRRTRLRRDGPLASCGARPPPSTRRAGRGRGSCTRLWRWEDGALTGWIATGPTPAEAGPPRRAPVRVAQLLGTRTTTPARPSAAPSSIYDDATRTEVWDALRQRRPRRLATTRSIIPVWTSPTADTFAALKLTPWRLRVMPGTVMTEGKGDILTWQSPD